MYNMVVLFPIFNSKFYIAMKVLKRCGSFPDCSLQDTRLSSTLNPYSTLDCFLMFLTGNLAHDYSAHL